MAPNEDGRRNACKRIRGRDRPKLRLIDIIGRDMKNIEVTRRIHSKIGTDSVEDFRRPKHIQDCSTNAEDDDVRKEV